MKVKINYNKEDYNWTIEVSTDIKVKTILAFDCLVKLHFMSKDTIHSFSHHISNRLLQPQLFLMLLEFAVKLITSLNHWLLTK